MLARLVALAALFGLLFGYDEGSIAGALRLISGSFTIGAFEQGMVTSAVPFGAVGGVLFAAVYADRLGRRRVLLLCSIFFIVGALGSGLATDVWLLTLARVVVGLSIGASCMAAPIYLAELAPAERRGAIVFTYQLLITIGILFAYLADDALEPFGAWRWMLALGAVPAAVTLFGLLAAPESPRWLAKHARAAEARKIIAAAQPDLAPQQLDATMTEIEQSGADGTRLREFFAPRHRYGTLFAIFSFTISALSGINAVIYYAPIIMTDAGFDAASSALVATVGIGVVNVLLTVVSIYVVDRVGRRPLFIVGFVGTSIAMAIVTLALALGGPEVAWLLLAGIFLFIAFFAVSLGPLPWLYMTELFPFDMRSRGMAMASAGNWSFNFLVVFFFPDMLVLLGPPVAFAIFFGFCLFGAVIAWRYAPETKGVSLEALEKRLASGRPRAEGQARAPV